MNRSSLAQLINRVLSAGGSIKRYTYKVIVIPLNTVEDGDVIEVWESMSRREHSEFYRLFKELIRIRKRLGRLDAVSLVEKILDGKRCAKSP